MSFRFENEHGKEYWLAAHKWTMVRWFAGHFGWNAPGTGPPEDLSEDNGEGWSGRYDTNDGQLVSRDDALGLAAALEAALASPEFDEHVDAIQSEYASQLEAASTPNVKLVLEPASADNWRQLLQEIITFCRRGAFRLH